MKGQTVNSRQIDSEVPGKLVLVKKSVSRVVVGELREGTTG